MEESWRCLASPCGWHVACGMVFDPGVGGTRSAGAPTPVEELKGTNNVIVIYRHFSNEGI